jgi:hypothetical protein
MNECVVMIGRVGREHLVVETSTVLHDIPYGDYFTIEGRWDVTTPSPGAARSLLVIRVGLNFSKKTILAGKIESTTIKQTQESYQMWAQLARDMIGTCSQSRSAASSRCVD